MQRRSSSPFWRYWLARLRPLTRPIIWGPTCFLALACLFAWELSTKPDWLTALGQSPPSAGSDLSKEEQAIGADIDTLPLLLNDFGLAVPGTDEAGDPATKPAGDKSDQMAALAGIPIVGAAKPEATAKPSLTNFGLTDNLPTGNRLSVGGSAATEAGDPAALPGFSLLQPNSTAPSALATALSQAQGNNLIPANQSALAAAMARYGNNVSTGGDPNRLTINPLAPLNSTTLPPLEGTTGLNGNSFGSSLNSNQPIVPLAGTTGLNTPIAPSGNAFSNLTGNQNPNGLVPAPAGVIPNPPVGTVSSFGPSGQPNPAGLPIAPAPATSPIQTNSQPFSVPRPVPGRSIGGGNINTFSNP
jgi:hypothetical protein